jgi:hypothetical protein
VTKLEASIDILARALPKIDRLIARAKKHGMSGLARQTSEFKKDVAKMLKDDKSKARKTKMTPLKRRLVRLHGKL